MSDIENLRDTTAPNSSQLNADDLAGTTRIVRVTAVKRGTSKQQPVSISFYGDDNRPYKPCLSMRRVLIQAWSDDGREWVGRSMKLYSDPEVMYGGVKLGGIRISHLSHIGSDLKVMLTVSKGIRKEFTFKKLPFYPDADFAENCNKWILAMQSGKITLDYVIDKAAATGILTEAQIELLKGAVQDGN